MHKNIKILAIESSCDETAAAIIEGESGHLYPKIVSNIVSSQVDLHAKTGGVVPEVASRAHLEMITPVIAEALLSSLGIKQDKIDFQKANSILKSEITHIAYTAGPGLIGSLLVGYNAAKTISYATSLPIMPVNHIEGHIYSAFAEEISNPPAGRAGDKYEKSNDYNQSRLSTEPRRKQFAISNKRIHFPLLALTVSGGHTSLTLMRGHGKYENIGQTLDDAAGEAFDKVAKLLELGYPGGPAVSKLANEYRNSNNQGTITKVQKNNNLTDNQLTNPQLQTPVSQLTFPRPIIKDGTFNFSFSGLKTAVREVVIKIEKDHELSNQDKLEISAAFEDAAVDVLTTKTLNAILKYKPKTVVLAGGVAANKQLRQVLKSKVEKIKPKIELFIPPLSLCGDNAAMIGLAAYYHIKNNNVTTWDKANVDSNLELT